MSRGLQEARASKPTKRCSSTMPRGQHASHALIMTSCHNWHPLIKQGCRGRSPLPEREVSSLPLSSQAGLRPAKGIMSGSQAGRFKSPKGEKKGPILARMRKNLNVSESEERPRDEL